MQKFLGISATFILLVAASLADTVILRDGTSYTGQAQADVISFAGAQGIQYQFPRQDVQTLVLNSATDTVMLRDGKSYSGKYKGSNPIVFHDNLGIKYEFP